MLKPVFCLLLSATLIWNNEELTCGAAWKFSWIYIYIYMFLLLFCFVFLLLGFFFCVCVLCCFYSMSRFQIVQCHVFVKQGNGLKSSPSKNGFRQHCTQDWIHPEHLWHHLALFSSSGGCALRCGIVFLKMYMARSAVLFFSWALMCFFLPLQVLRFCSSQERFIIFSLI